jgi:hypothetical protein
VSETVNIPGFHKPGEQIGKIHHRRQLQEAFQSARSHRGNGMLRDEHVEFRLPRRPRRQPRQKKRIEQVFDVAQAGVTIHLPLGEGMKADAEFFFDGRRAVDLWAEDMNLVPPPPHFLDQIDCLSRAAAGGRVKRLVRQKRNSQRTWGEMHDQTLFHRGRRIQSKSCHHRRCFARCFGAPPGLVFAAKQLMHRFA